MKFIKLILSFCFLWNALTSSFMMTFAEDKQVQNTNSDFVIENGVLLEYTGTSTSITIPEGVKEIAKSVFEYKNLVSVTFPEGLEIIGEEAFEANKIVGVTFPSSLKKIGDYAFWNNEINSLSLPDNVEYIGIHSFGYNNIVSVDLPDGIKRIEPYSFANNKIEELDLPVGLEYLAGFQNNKITKVRIPDTVVTIGSNAFASNLLTEVEIPTSVTKIESDAFANNKLSTVNIPNSITSLSGFSGNEITALSIPSTVKVIDYYAFSNNPIDSLTIPGNIEVINGGAFSNCGIKTLVMNEGVINVGHNAFENNSLSEVTIPASVTELSDLCFGNNELTKVTILSKSLVIGRETFVNNKIEEIEFPLGVTSIGEAAFQNNNIKSVIFSSTITSIGAYSFENNEIVELVLPDSITEMGEGAFQGNKISLLTLSKSLDTIPSYSFSNNELVSLTIPENIKNIEYYAFENNKLSVLKFSEPLELLSGFGYNQLSSIEIPEGVKRIGVNAFRNNKLKTAIIPDTVEWIESDAFSNNVLSKVKLSKNMKYVDIRAFDNNDLASIVIPESTLQLSSGSFTNNKIKSVIIPEGTEIGHSWGSFGTPFDSTVLHYVKAGSIAEEYCVKKNLLYDYYNEAIDSIQSEITGREVGFYFIDSITKEPITNQRFIVQGKAYTTSNDGTVKVNVSASNTLNAQISTYGYKNKYVVLELGKVNTIQMVPFTEMFESVMYNNETDVLSKTKTLYSNDVGTFDISVQLFNEIPGLYEIRQGRMVVASSETGEFNDLSVNQFVAEHDITIRFVSEQTSIDEVKKLNLIIKAQESDYIKVELGNKMSLTVPENIPVFGNTKIELDMPYLPVYFDVSGDYVKVIITTGELDDKNEDFIESVKDVLFKKEFAGIKGWLAEGKKDNFDKMTKTFHALFGDDDGGSFNIFQTKAKIEVYGYLEGNKNEGLSGKVAFVIKGSAEATRQLSLFSVPCIITFSISSELKDEHEIALIPYGKVQLGDIFNMIDEEIEHSASVSLGAGPGIKGATHLTVNGAGTLKNSFSWNDFQLKQSSLNLKAYFEAKLFFLKYQKTLAETNYLIYSDKMKFSETIPYNSVYSEMLNFDNYQISDRYYLDYQTTWGQDVSAYSVGKDEIQYLQLSTYHDSQPRMIQVGDKTILFFLGDDVERNLVNKSALMFSVYNGESWSPPQIVEQDGTMDANYDIHVLNDKCYVAWTDFKKVFTDDVTESEMISELSISLATFDEDTNTFVSQDMDMLDGARYPKVSSFDNQLHIIVAKNDDLFMQGETTLINIVMSSNLDVVEEYRYAKNNSVLDYQVGNKYISVMMDMDSDYSTMEDHSLFFIDRETGELSYVATNVSDAGSFVEFLDEEQFLYCVNGMLYKKNGPSHEELFPVGSNFTIIRNGEEICLLYLKDIVKDDDSLNQIYLKRYVSHDQTWSEEIQVTNFATSVNEFDAISNRGTLEFFINDVFYEINENEEIVPIYNLGLYTFEKEEKVNVDWMYMDNYKMSNDNKYQATVYYQLSNIASKTIDKLYLDLIVNDVSVDRIELSSLVSGQIDSGDKIFTFDEIILDSDCVSINVSSEDSVLWTEEIKFVNDNTLIDVESERLDGIQFYYLFIKNESPLPKDVSINMFFDEENADCLESTVYEGRMAGFEERLEIVQVNLKEKVTEGSRSVIFTLNVQEEEYLQDNKYSETIFYAQEEAKYQCVKNIYIENDLGEYELYSSILEGSNQPEFGLEIENLVAYQFDTLNQNNILEGNAAEGKCELSAYYKLKRYPVRYIDGNNIQELIVAHGDIVNQNKLEKKGYTFEGWYLDNQMTKLYDFNIPVDRALDLYAKWTTDLSDLNASLKKASLINQSNYTDDSLQKLNEAKSKATLLLGRNDLTPEHITNAVNDISSAIDALCLKEFTVTYLLDESTEYMKVSIKVGTNIQHPEAPKLPGFIFTGWDKEIPESMPAENLVFVAQWESSRKEVVTIKAGLLNINLENLYEGKHDDGEYERILVVSIPRYLANVTSMDKLMVDGYLYAGAFTDVSCTKETAILDISAHSGNFYAKFVTEDVFKVMAQSSVGIKDAEKGKLRLITSVDSLNYREVGFEIDIESLSKSDQISKVVYTTMYATSNGKKIVYTPSMISQESKYFLTKVVVGIPQSFHDKKFTIRAFWVTLDGAKIYGNPYVKVIKDLPGYN